MQLTEFVVSLMKKYVMGDMDALEEMLAQRPDAIHASANSPERFNMLEQAGDREDIRPPAVARSLPHMLASQVGIRRSLRDLERNPEKPRTQITPEDLAALEAFALKHGVTSFGYIKLPQDVIFKDKALILDNAMVLTMEMDKQKMNTAPSPASNLAAMEIYHHLGDASNAIARFLRRRGYAAHAGHPLMGMALYPPLAQMAGLGWRGRHGLLITPEHGLRVRLTAVFMGVENLPLYSKTNPHEWIPQFCKTCGACIRSCPSQAIYETPLTHDNGLVTCVDVDKCFPQFTENLGCSVCIRVCPFNRGLYDKLKQRVEERV